MQRNILTKSTASKVISKFKQFCMRFLVVATMLSFLNASAIAQTSSNSNLIFCAGGDPSHFDPGQLTTGTDFSASANVIYNRLIEFQSGTSAIEPGLAEKWTISDDGLEYIFSLRKNVKFHTNFDFKPQRHFNADDVIFTFKRFMDKNYGFNQIYPSTFPYFESMGLSKNIVRVEKLDEYKVRFLLKDVDAPFLQNLAMPSFSILSKEYADYLVKNNRVAQIAQQPIGTGPFIFTNYKRGAVIRYRKNPEYWAPERVGVDRLIFSIVKDSATRLQKMRIGECDVSEHPKPSELSQYKNAPNINVMEKVGFHLSYLAINHTKKPFDNENVRKALELAINKAELVKHVHNMQADIASNAMPPSQWSSIDTQDQITNAYNPKLAKELLQQAGFDFNQIIRLHAMDIQRPYNPNARLTAEMIQGDWKKIGIKTMIVQAEWGKYGSDMRAGRYDVALYGWSGDNGDPDNWLNALLGCNAIGGTNVSRYCGNKDGFEQLVEWARQTLSTPERIKLYQKAQKIFAVKRPFIPLTYARTFQPVNKRVNNFVVQLMGSTSFTDMQINRYIINE